MLRAAQLGIGVRDLELMTVGMLLDIYTESANDDFEYPEVATQADFDRF